MVKFLALCGELTISGSNLVGIRFSIAFFYFKN